jgi:4-hydroxy-4-methyl-2-oxoglutarate aldolase
MRKPATNDALRTAAVATAGGSLVRVIAGLENAWFGARLVGRAFTVCGRAKDNLALHRGLAEASAGEVIVAQLVGKGEGGHWGGLMTIAAQVRGIAGVVMGGTVRDRAEFAARRFPVFHRGTCPCPAAKRVPGKLRVPIRLGGVVIEHGDLVVADDDGIVVVPERWIKRVTADTLALIAREKAMAERLAKGETSIKVLGLKLDGRR